MRLGITRTASQLGELSRQADARDIQVVPLPLVTAEPIAFDWPASLDKSGPDWLFFSSSKAVVTFFQRIRSSGRSIPISTQIGAIGGQTAQALKRFDCNPDFVPTEAYGEKLFEEYAAKHAGPGQSLIYARATLVHYDPAALMASLQIRYYPIICYDLKEQPVDSSLVESFVSSDAILFTSPSSVMSFNGRFGPPRAIPLAIGKTTANTMQQHGWTEYHTMKRPIVADVLEYLP